MIRELGSESVVVSGGAVKGILGQLKTFTEQHSELVIAFGVGALRIAGAPLVPLALLAGLFYVADNNNKSDQK